MLAEVRTLAERLSAEERDEECFTGNNDHDFGFEEVLKCCSNGIVTQHEILYSDGQKKGLTFEQKNET